MSSNFSCLQKEAIYNDIYTACVEAEQSIAVSNSAAALQTRRALEIAVKWVYQYDSDLEVPYNDNLSSLIHDYKFKGIIDRDLFQRIRFVITLGNKAAHTAKSMKRVEAIESLRSLHEFIGWVDYSYSEQEGKKIPFDASLLPDGLELEKRSQKMRQELEAKEKAWEAERQELRKQLRSAKERLAFTKKREENQKSRDFACEDISEYKTRKLYINLALEEAGWEIGNDCREEVEVTGMPNQSGKGAVDYVLYGDNGLPLAVVEAKRASVDPAKGKIQAKLYAECLEKEHGVAPFIFYTNGLDTWFLDSHDYPARRIFDFFTKEELEWFRFRNTNKKPIDSVTVNDNITDRVYQKKAIQAVCDSLENKQRKALLVMATGSGKTRTAVSIVDVLQRNGWIKRVLFLADRRILVSQAKTAFNRLLPNLSTCNLLIGKDDPNSRMVFSTYPTMMNAIDDTRTEKGSRLFTPAHFDLIIIDESHRSIYKKYQDLFSYFDGFLLGLTATPKDDIDKNTYSIFDLENNVPTFAYELEEAVKEGYLVPYNTIETKMRLMEEGVHYDDLSDEEKEHWEETFDDDVKDIPAEELNKQLFNDDTVDKVLHNLMEKGIKVEGGDKIGKTIIFAQNTRHADFIRQRFNIRYPSHRDMAETIYNGIKYVESEIDKFKIKEQNPQIAISVDMLDTGVDIPELVNLVFFKRVRSKAKFWQMIGRGTRLCNDLFGIEQDKESFLIFDYCTNFEFFRVNKKGIEAKIAKSLTENLFNIRVKIARELEHLDYQVEEYKEYRSTLVEQLIQSINTIDRDHFANKKVIQQIGHYNKVETWQSITDKMQRDLEELIAPRVVPADENELAKRFDYLIYTIELATLQGAPAEKSQRRVMDTAVKLAAKGNLTQVQRHADLIREVQTKEFWKEADIFAHEKVRDALRDLLILLERENKAIYYTSFTDEVTHVAENPMEYGDSDLESYRDKVNNYLRDHMNDIVVHKLRNNHPLTESDFQHLETVLWQNLGTKEDYNREFGEEPLMKMIAEMVGMERSAANKIFSEFINDQSLNRNQMEFISMIVDFIVANGMFQKENLNELPYNKHGDVIELFADNIEIAKNIFKRIDELNNRTVKIS